MADLENDLQEARPPREELRGCVEREEILTRREKGIRDNRGDDRMESAREVILSHV
jgi:hypothetical protein